MPQSRHRHKHTHHHSARAQQHAVKAAPRRSAVPIMIIFLAVLGMFIAFIASDGWLWIAAGGVVGALAGYFIGHSMDKTAKE